MTFSKKCKKFKISLPKPSSSDIYISKSHFLGFNFFLIASKCPKFDFFIKEFKRYSLPPKSLPKSYIAQKFVFGPLFSLSKIQNPHYLSSLSPL